MKHQNEGSAKELKADEIGVIDFDRTVSREEIERHIAAGKRMQAEAIAGFFTACSQRLTRLFQQRPQGAGHFSRA